jgi:2-phosphoglycerate kinase
MSKVFLIGGPPFVGKSSVARCIAGRFGFNCICTDDIAKAIRAVTTVQTHPGLHSADDADYQDYFTKFSVEALIEHSRRSHLRKSYVLTPLGMTLLSWKVMHCGQSR